MLTNPDMLHVGILPHHAAWGDFLANLALVVVDEAHVYRGVFGSHVANVLRRLRRLADAYGTTPRFVLTSATIANPLSLAQELTGLEFDLVDSRRLPARRARGRDVQPAAARRAHRPPRIRASARRRSCSPTWSRRACARSASRAAGARRELIYQFARKRLEDAGDHADRVTPYRAGYTPQQRREIERRPRERTSCSAW